MRNSFILIFLVLLLNSCAIHSGLMTGNASLNNSDFQVVELAVGHSSVSYFLGIGGLETDAIVLEAKKDLLRNYPLKQGQVLANVTVDFKRSYFILFNKTSVTVSADVIEFSKPENSNFDQINAANLSNGKASISIFEKGDSVLVIRANRPKRAEIIGFSNNRIKVKFKGSDDKVYTSDFQPRDVLIRNSSDANIELYGYDVGEKVWAKVSSKEEKESVIFGINGYLVGVKYDFQEDGSFSWKLLSLDKLRKM